MKQSSIHGKTTDTLEAIEVTVRAYTALRRHGIKTVTELEAMTDDQLLAVHGFGLESLRSVRTALRKHSRPKQRKPLIRDYTSVDSLGLPPRACNALSRLQVATVMQLRELPDHRMRNEAGIGVATMDAIRTALRTYDRELRDGVRSPIVEKPILVNGNQQRRPTTVRGWYELIMGQLPSRDAFVIKRRWGIADGEKPTLEELGKEMGITRERVRQVESRALQKLRDWPVDSRPTSFLNKVMRLAVECTDVATSEDDLIVNLQIGGINLVPEDLRILGGFVGLGWATKPAGVTVEFGSALPVVRAPDGVAQILRLAHKHARNTGAASSRVVAALLSVPQDECYHILVLNGFRRLDGEWLIPPAMTDPVLSNIVVLHAYCGDVLSLQTIRQALRRRHRRRPEYRAMPIPPISVLGEAMRTNEQFCVVGSNIRWKPRDAIDSDVELSGATQIIMEVFDRFNVATFFEIRDAVVARGFAAITATAALAWSGLFHRIEVGLYVRTGTAISLGDLRAAHSRRPPDVAAQATVSYLKTGGVRLEINIGSWGEGGVIANPRFERLAGRWPILVGGYPAGVAVAKDTFLYGLSSAFEKLQIGRGDRVRFDFDMRARSVEVTRLA